MSGKLLIRTALHPYHVTTRSNNKEWFDLSMTEVWELSQQCLRETYNRYSFELYSFVLMSNHYHMILRTPDQNLDQIMIEFNSRFSEALRHRTNQIFRIFDGGYKWTLIDNNAYLFNVVKYVYQNPLRASLVQYCESYPFSDLYYQIRGMTFCIPMHGFYYLDGYFLSRINIQSSLEDDQRTRAGLRGERFRASSPNRPSTFRNKHI